MKNHKNLKQVKEEFIQKNIAEKKAAGIEHPSYRRACQEFEKSIERTNYMFRGVDSRITGYESNFQDYDDVG